MELAWDLVGAVNNGATPSSIFTSHPNLYHKENLIEEYIVLYSRKSFIINSRYPIVFINIFYIKKTFSDNGKMKIGLPCVFST